MTRGRVRPAKGVQIEVKPLILEDNEWHTARVVCLLDTQFIADCGGTEMFFFYTDFGCTWRVL